MAGCPALTTHHDLPIDPDLAGTPRRVQPSVLAAVAIGGGLGGPARYAMAQLIHVGAGQFPWATFTINISGSFALGLFLALLLEHFPPTRHARPLVATGFLGAYTTYSTFTVEADLLVKDGHAIVAVAYAAASVVTGLVAVWAGMSAARAFVRGSDR